MLLSRFAEETDLLDWYFIWFLRLGSFCFYQCVYFCKKSLFQVECFEGSTYVGFDLSPSALEMYVCFVCLL